MAWIALQWQSRWLKTASAGKWHAARGQQRSLAGRYWIPLVAKSGSTCQRLPSATVKGTRRVKTNQPAWPKARSVLRHLDQSALFCLVRIGRQDLLHILAMQVRLYTYSIAGMAVRYKKMVDSLTCFLSVMVPFAGWIDSDGNAVLQREMSDQAYHIGEKLLFSAVTSDCRWGVQCKLKA
jgi:hypothetical protein